MVFPIPLEESSKSLLPESPVGRIEQGQYLASREFFFLPLHLEGKSEGAGKFIEKGREG